MEVEQNGQEQHEDVQKRNKPRVFFRRIMYNGERAETTQHSEEDRRRTLISLQGGRKFGRATDNNVLFFDKSEIVEREPQIISRFHATIDHLISEDDGANGYILKDSSENGTYVNDKRLPKGGRHLIQVGDTIKFGHKNGSRHKGGQVYPNPTADFAFCATLCKHDDPIFPLLEELKGVRVKIYIGSPFVEEVEKSERNTPEPTPPPIMKPSRGGVQQQEADSTNGKFPEVVGTTAINHPGTSSSSSTSSSASSTAPSSSTPSSDSSTDLSVEPSTSSPVAMANGAKQPTPPVSAPLDEQQPSTSRHHEEKIILRKYPKKAPHVKKFDDHGSPSWTNCIVRRSRAYWKMVEDQATRILKLHKDLIPYAEILEYLCDVNIGKDFAPSKQQKLEMIDQFWQWNKNAKNVDKIYAFKDVLSDRLLEEEPETKKIRDFIIHYVPAGPPGSKEVEHSEYSAFESLISDQKFYVPIAKQVNYTEMDYISHLRDIKLLDTHAEESIRNILNGFPKKDPALPMSRELMDWLYRLGYFEQLQKQIPPAIMQHFQHYLQNTGVVEFAPRESVIVKSAFTPVLNKDEHPRAEMDEERHSASSGSTDPPENSENTENPENNLVQTFRNRTDSVESEIVDVVGGAEEEEDSKDESDATLTPSPEDEEQQKMRKIEDRSSSTPRIDAQSASSAAVSALPTPLSSPVPGPSSAPGPSAPPVGQRSALASPALPGPSTSRREEDIPSTSSAASSSSKPRKQEKEKHRRNKQLDSSGESESDDGDGDNRTPSQKNKKSVRRSTRAPNTVPKRSKKKEDGEDPDDEVTPRASGSNSARRKPLKRSGSQTGFKDRKEPRREAGDSEEPPKKKRGRKKATPPPRDGEEGEDTPKELCGVRGKYCLCSKWEKKYTLEWVSCSACDQWYHAFCVRMDNRAYGAEEMFICCGATATEEARSCLDGTIHQTYMSFPRGARPVPQDPPKDQIAPDRRNN